MKFILSVLLSFVTLLIWKAEGKAEDAFEIENKQVPIICIIPGWNLGDYDFAFRHPATISAPTGITMLLGRPKQYATLSMPGCRVQQFLEPKAFFDMAGFTYDYKYYVPSGAILYHNYCTSAQCNSIITRPEEAERSIVLPVPASGSAVLSNDGRWVLWMENNPDYKPAFIYGWGTVNTVRIHAYDIISKEQRLIPLPAEKAQALQKSKELQILAADMEKSEIMLLYNPGVKAISERARKSKPFPGNNTSRISITDINPSEPESSPVALFSGIYWVNGEGKEIRKRGGLSMPSTIFQQFPNGYLQFSDGWFAWEQYDGTGSASHVAWNLSGNVSSYVLPELVTAFPFQGSIEHAAISPDGKYIALGVGFHSRLIVRNGFMQLMRTDNQRAILTVPMVTENGPNVAFVGNNLLFSRFNKEEKRHETLVIALP